MRIESGCGSKLHIKSPLQEITWVFYLLCEIMNFIFFISILENRHGIQNWYIENAYFGIQALLLCEEGR